MQLSYMLVSSSHTIQLYKAKRKYKSNTELYLKLEKESED